MRREIEWEATRRYEALMAQHRADEFPFHSCIPSADEAIARAAALREQAGVDQSGAGGAVGVAHGGFDLGGDVLPVEGRKLDSIVAAQRLNAGEFGVRGVRHYGSLHAVDGHATQGSEHDNNT